jgi:hypothetical protein
MSAIVVLAAACGGSEDSSTTTTDSTAAPATTQPATTEPPATEPPATTRPATTEPPATTQPETTAAPATTQPATTEPPTGAAGTAVVEVGGDRFEFRVTQCLRGRPSAFGDTIIDVTLDGVPVDTPQELIDPLLGEIDPELDLFPLVEPVAEFGPLLSVSRFEGGGDYVVVYDLDVIEITSDPDPMSSDSRFLDVPDGETGITISGATTAGGAPLTLSATCP